MIKQVIDGKTYNTETERCLATVDLMGYRTDEKGRFTTNTPKKVGTTSLYETRGGAYFLVRDYDPAGFFAEPDLVGQFRIHDRGVIPLKRKEALGWAESKGLDSDKVEEMLTVFGFGDFVVSRGKHVANNLAIIRLVFDHQNALAYAASTCRSGSREA